MPESIIKRWAEDEGFGTPAPPDIAPDSEWAFDPTQPRDREGKWRKVPGGDFDLPAIPGKSSWGEARRDSMIGLQGKRKETLDEATKRLDATVRMPDGMPELTIGNLDPVLEHASGLFEEGDPTAITDPKVTDKTPYLPRLSYRETAGPTTVTHEFGHYLDRYANTDETEPGARPATIIGGSTGFFEPRDEDVDLAAGKLQDAILESPAHRALFDPSQLPDVYVVNGEIDPYVDYIRDPHETFARAFAQYVAVKTGTIDELRETYAGKQDMRERFGGDDEKIHEVVRLFVLDDDDFAPIEKAFDDYFDARGLREGLTPYAGPETEVGITPYREGGSGPEFFATARYKAFEDQVQIQADDLGLEIESFDRTRGVWAGGGEPAARIRLRGKRANVHEFMDRIGKRFDQDAVIAWRGNADGPDKRYTSKEPLEVPDATVEETIAEVNKGLPEDQQIQGATRGPDGRLVFIDMGGNSAQAIRDVAEKLDIWFDYAKGTGELRFKGDDY